MHRRKMDTAVDTRICCKFFFLPFRSSSSLIHIFINWSFNKSDMTAIIAWYCLFYNPSASKFTKYNVSRTKDDSKSPSLTLITILEISAIFVIYFSIKCETKTPILVIIFAMLSHAVWLEIFEGSNFCDFCGFSSDPQK